MPEPLESRAIIQVVLKGSYQGQTTMNVLLYEYQDTIEVADYRDHMNTMHDTFKAANALYDDYLGACNDSFSLDEIMLQPVWPTRLTPVIKTLEAHQGLVVGDPMPPNVAAVITKQCAQATRRGRGAMHVPAVAFPNILAGVLKTDYVTLLDALGEELTVPAATSLGGDTVPVLWDYDEDHAALRIVQTFTQPTVRVMRRRTVGLGI